MEEDKRPYLDLENCVTKSNILNELRSNSMTLQELRFFSIYLSKIKYDDLSTRKVRFSLEDFRAIMDFKRLKVSRIQEATDSLLGKVVRVPTERGGYDSFQLFKKCRLDKDEYDRWYIEIDAHDDALPLMFEFKNKYFSYELWNALKLKSPNQLRMYEILKQYQKIGSRSLALDDLKGYLGIAKEEYPRWERFKARVLDSCQEALAANTDIIYEYEPIRSARRGGKILGVKFTIKKNPNHVDQLSLSEFIEKNRDPAELPAQLEDDVSVNDPIDSSDTFSSENTYDPRYQEWLETWQGVLEPFKLSLAEVDYIATPARAVVSAAYPKWSPDDIYLETSNYLARARKYALAHTIKTTPKAYLYWLFTHEETQEQFLV